MTGRDTVYTIVGLIKRVTLPCLRRQYIILYMCSVWSRQEQSHYGAFTGVCESIDRTIVYLSWLDSSRLWVVLYPKIQILDGLL
jgi:hypothetical protein